MALDLTKIQDSPHLLDILLQMEDVLDSLDVYVFKNWYLGEIAEGPVVRRYWLDFTLKYQYDKMPDPRAALRLLKHGIRVDFWKAKLKDGDFVDAEDDRVAEEKGTQEVGAAPVEEKDPAKDTVWLVRISIPRRLAAQMSAEEMDFYDDEVDVDDVEDAKDTGIDDESAYMSGEDGQQPGDAGNPNQQAPVDPNAPQPPQQGGPNNGF
jgi:hypothetical protein